MCRLLGCGAKGSAEEKSLKCTVADENADPGVPEYLTKYESTTKLMQFLLEKEANADKKKQLKTPVMILHEYCTRNKIQVRHLIQGFLSPPCSLRYELVPWVCIEACPGAYIKAIQRWFLIPEKQVDCMSLL